jgi:glycosyltransferase 2 family protein
VWHTASAAHWPYLLLAGAITTFTYVLRAVRWRILLNAEARLGMATVFCANMAGYLGNNFLPARAGEILRTVMISRRSALSKAYVLTTALGERSMDAIAVVLWASLALLGVDPKPQWIAHLSWSLTIAALGAVAVTVILPHTGGWIERILKLLPLPHKFRDLLLRIAEQVLMGLRAFHSWKRLGGFALLTVVVWTFDALTMMSTAHALGLPMPFRVAVLLLAGMALGSSLPSTPGYVGIYQFVAVTVLPPFGIGRDDAVAYILVAQALGYVVVLSIGLPAVYWFQRTSKEPARESSVNKY